MKKKVKRLYLSRETLRSLETLHFSALGGVQGGALTIALGCGGNTAKCSLPCDSGFGCGPSNILETCGVCSGNCETGGTACTGLSCG